jgi:hypothetical protein
MFGLHPLVSDCTLSRPTFNSEWLLVLPPFCDLRIRCRSKEVQGRTAQITTCSPPTRAIAGLATSMVATRVTTNPAQSVAMLE